MLGAIEAKGRRRDWTSGRKGAWGLNKGGQEVDGRAFDWRSAELI